MAELREEMVLDKFSLYSGETEEDARRWELCCALCEDCRKWVEDQVLPGWESIQEQLESLAAAEAFYQLTLVDEALAPASVSAPELKLEMGNRGEKALRLAEEKRKACAGVLREREFYFGRVTA